MIDELENTTRLSSLRPFDPCEQMRIRLSIKNDRIDERKLYRRPYFFPLFSLLFVVVIIIIITVFSGTVHVARPPVQRVSWMSRQKDGFKERRFRSIR